MAESTPLTPAPRRAVLAGFLAAAGVALFIYGLNRFQKPDALNASLAILICGVTFGALAADTGLTRLVDRFRNPTDRGRRLTTILVGVLGAAYLLWCNIWFGRSLLPYWHDDQMHTLQARMFAAGHLTMPEHPLADFFETFHVFVKPFYSGIHFLGTTLLNAPGLKLGFPTWVVPILLTAVAVGLAYRVVTELTDGLYGLLAALLLCSLDFVRFLCTRVMSHGAMLALGMLLAWAYLRWRRRPGYGWAILVGALAGLSMITRPLDAAAYLAPLGLAMLFDRSGPAWKPRLLHAAVAGACVLPFVGLQLCFDKQVTGRWLYSPYQYYNDLNYPGVNYDPRRQAIGEEQVEDTPSLLPQKQEYYHKFLLLFVRGVHSSSMFKHVVDDRIMWTLRYGLPDILLVVLLPLGFLGMRTVPRLAVAAVPVVYIGLYIPHYFYLTHYAVIIAPSLFLLVLLGVRALPTIWPSQARRAEFAGLAVVTAAALSSMPPLAGLDVDDAGPAMGDAAFANERLPALLKKPAVVLFRYTPGMNFHDEPVYNFETAWPDDQTIVRAQDLGPRNIELFRYYAQKQPNRTAYLFDRASHRLTELGNVAALAGTATTGPATTRP